MTIEDDKSLATQEKSYDEEEPEGKVDYVGELYSALIDLKEETKKNKEMKQAKQLRRNNVLDEILSVQRSPHIKTGLGFSQSESSNTIKTKGNGTATNLVRFIKEQQKNSHVDKSTKQRMDKDGYTKVSYQKFIDQNRDSRQSQNFKGYCYGCNKFRHRVQIAKKASQKNCEEKHPPQKQIAFKAHSNEAPWILDSGCSTHMTGDKDRFLSLNAVEGGSVRFDNNDGAKIKGRGSIKLDKGKLKSNNVLYVSGLKHNLLSVSQLCDDGHAVLFIKEECVIKKTKNGKTVVAQGTRTIGNLYVLLDVGEDKCMLSQEDENWLWHRRLGHINFKNLAKLSKRKQ
ncbi:uncharacterized protein LOC122665457 [Telopea speciosissima]|uniref:uncharacterized protein LOC122665457 n=1 Tax=Telopea speciosissima TaxID=54955 RepID=UPI001CC5DF0D|nr:uncharacterized protein LOC122665457 [Telopea speciosissima]